MTPKEPMLADCKETLGELETFLDGELSEDARRAIRAHLDGCRDCLELFDFQAELKAMIATRCTDELPQGLRERIERCFQTELDDQ